MPIVDAVKPYQSNIIFSWKNVHKLNFEEIINLLHLEPGITFMTFYCPSFNMLEKANTIRL
jgi:hypothetical protein